MATIGQVETLEFPVFEIDGITPKTGLVDGDFTKELWKNDVLQSSSLITIVEKGTLSGKYKASFTPTERAKYEIYITNPSPDNQTYLGTIKIEDFDLIENTVNIEDKVDIIDTNIDSILTNTISIENKIDIIDSNIDSIIITLGNIEAKINIIDSNVDDIKTDLALVALESTVQTINSTVNLIKTDTTNILSDLSTIDGIVDIINENVIRLLGLSHENIYVKNTFSGDLHTGSVVEIYDTKINTLNHDGFTGLIAKYTLDVNYVGTNIDEHIMVKEDEVIPE